MVQGAGDEFAHDTPTRQRNTKEGERGCPRFCLCVFVVPQRTRATAVEAVVDPWEASVNAMVAQLVPAAEIH